MRDKLIVWLTTDLVSARSVIAYLIYGTASAIWLMGREVPEALVGVIGALMGFYFGTKGRNGAPPA